MTVRAVVLRPQPGNDHSARQLSARGVPVLQLPLFAARALRWAVPDADGYDALLLTSGNAARLGGEGLTRLAALPVIAVGPATARAASAAGFTVALTGGGDASEAAALARAAGLLRLLHLAGADRVEVAGVDSIAVYASDPLALPAGVTTACAGGVALLHSRRAAARFGDLIDRDRVPRRSVALAALSRAVADAAGQGWATVAVPDRPTDAALVDHAAALALTGAAAAGISGS